MLESSPKNTVMGDHNNILESNRDEAIGGNKDQKLESVKGEMVEVREENGRLKFLLARLIKDYQSRQMDFFDILQHDKQEEATSKSTGTADSHEENIEESELVSLSLGMSSSKGLPIMDKKKNDNRTDEKREDENLDGRLEMWPPTKVLKTMRTGDKSEASQPTQFKKARVSIRARCDTQTMNDGCQWRKYGQKIAKGNPCPRAYYRCNVTPTCPVRKQVQRCAEDMSVLITTYEGTHNHPLPTSATVMASTTSAAASMLQSPPLVSQQANSDTVPIINPGVAYNLDPLDFSSFQISRPQHFYFPNSSISTSNSHPTITLDLTAPPPSSHFGKCTSGFSGIPKYSSTNLNFSSSFSPLQPSMLQSPRSPYIGHFNNGTPTQNTNQSGSLMNTGKQPFQVHLYQPNYMSNHFICQQPLQDSISAATKAITANQKFQSALAAALTTYVDNGSAAGGVTENHHARAESAALKLKLGGDHMPYTKNTVYTSSQNGPVCASSRYLNMSSSAPNAQQGNLIIFPTPPAASESAFGSPSDKSNQLLEQRK